MKEARTVRFSSDMFLFVVLLAGVGWLLYTYSVLIGPLVISALVAYLLNPFVNFLAKRLSLPRRRPE